jgi:uncharacterized protein YkwD
MALKNWLIANTKNNFHPYILRPFGLALCLALILSLTPIYNITITRQFRAFGYTSSISSSELHSLTNQERTKKGLKPLKTNSLLNNAANAKAKDMFKKDYWSHTSPDGKEFWVFVSEAGYAYKTCGENLAKGFSTSAGVINAWMGSSGHRANILNSSYVEAGYAVMNGTLQGEETTLVVAIYGAPKASPPPAPAPSPAPTSPTPTAPSAPAPRQTETQTAPKPEQKPAPKPTEAAKEEPVAVATDDKGQPNEVTQTAEPTPELKPPTFSYSSLNWGQRASLFLLSGLMFLNIMKHTIIWRHQRRGYKHIWLRSHPIAQASLLFFAAVITVSSSIGVIR